MATLSGIAVEVFVGLVVIAIVGIIGWLWNQSLQAKDTDKIIAFLKSDDHQFLTTHFIASGVNLPVERVQKLCGNSKNIRRNQKEKESWTLKI